MINKDGIDWALSPFQCLILLGLWAILKCVIHNTELGDKQYSRTVKVLRLLYSSARTALVRGNIFDTLNKD